MDNPKIIKQIRLSEKYEQNYCPYCRQELKAEGKNFKEILSPMRKFTTVETVTRADGSQFEYFDNFYTCDRECCKEKKMTERQIVKKVTCRFDGTKWEEKSKPYMRWDNQSKSYYEVTTNDF
jgi:hypothetical protein